MPTLSLIIPVYNVEFYLSECLDSCINQTFKDIEIICIDDCSTDNSKNILNDYKLKDERIKIIYHDVNKGLGAARNAGVGIATSNYCWFLDSDDYILLNSCEILNDLINEYKTDIIRFNRIDYSYNNITKTKNILLQKNYSWETNKIFYRNDYTKLDMPEVSACMYITLTSLLKTIKFRENKVIHEDTDFTPILFSKANNIYNTNYSFYCVRQRMGSITNNINGMTEKHFLGINLAINSIYKYILSEKLPKNHFCTITALKLFNYYRNEYNKYSNIKSSDLDQLFKKNYLLLKPYYRNIINQYNKIIIKILNIIKRCLTIE